jgi:tetratricopeptide (TPR) repeat protein
MDELIGSPVPWGPLLAKVADAGFCSVKAPEFPTSFLMQNIMENIAEISEQPNFSTLSAALELHQRNLEFDPVLTAADVHSLALYSQQAAAQELLFRQAQAPAAQRWLAKAVSANRQLLQLDPPAAACLHCKRGDLMADTNRRQDVVASYRLALREAPEHKCERGLHAHPSASCAIPFWHPT